MRLTRRKGSVLVAALSLVVVVASSGSIASSQDTPQSLEDLFEAFEIESIPGDVVIVIDTSASMQDPPHLYGEVLAAVRSFIDALGSNDYLSVLSFDSVPNILFADEISSPEDREQAKRALPDVPRGQRTDIGAAFAAVLDRLERPASNEIQTVFFLTDGVHDPPASSPYQGTTGPRWDALAARAEQVGGGHDLSVYGAGLEGGGRTDVGLVQDVFPDTRLVSLPPDQLQAFLDEIVVRSQIQKVQGPLSRELAGGIEVVGPDEAVGTDGRATAEIRVRSGLEVLTVGVEVSNLRAHQTEASVVSFSPRTFELAPGEEATLEVRLETATEDEGGLGRETRERPIDIAVDLQAVAQPSGIIERDLSQRPDVPVGGGDVVVRLVETSGVPWPLVILVALVGLLVLGGAAYGIRRWGVVPALNGVLKLPDGEELSLGGSGVMTLPPESIEDSQRAPGASCELFTKRGERGAIFVRPIAGRVLVGRPRREDVLSEERRLGAGDVIEVGSFRATWFPD